MTKQLKFDLNAPMTPPPQATSWAETREELARQNENRPEVRRTSIEAWQSVMACGWAAEVAKLAYTALYESGPLTLLELEREVARTQKRLPVGRSESTAVRRLYDLRDAGLVRCTNEYRACHVSLKKSVTWDVTDALAPAIKPEKRVRELKAGDSVVVPLRYEDNKRRLFLKVTRIRGQVLLAFEGYGEKTAADGHGQPVMIELDQDDKPRVIVWSDINREEPTHVIDLEGAREDARDARECSHCGSVNTAHLQGNEYECHDCGKTYTSKGKPL